MKPQNNFPLPTSLPHKRTILKIIIILVGIIVVGAAVYEAVSYFRINIQSSDKSSDNSFLNREKCRSLGENYFSDLKQRVAKEDLGAFEPEYAFSKKLNTCVVSTGYFGNSSSGIDHVFIVDLLSNRFLAEYFPRILDVNYIKKNPIEAHSVVKEDLTAHISFLELKKNIFDGYLSETEHLLLDGLRSLEND